MDVFDIISALFLGHSLGAGGAYRLYRDERLCWYHVSTLIVELHSFFLLAAASIAGMELQDHHNFDVRVFGFGCPALVSQDLAVKADFITVRRLCPIPVA